MRTNFTVSLAKIISEFSLETLNMPANPEKIQISTRRSGRSSGNRNQPVRNVDG